MEGHPHVRPGLPVPPSVHPLTSSSPPNPVPSPRSGSIPPSSPFPNPQPAIPRLSSSDPPPPPPPPPPPGSTIFRSSSAPLSSVVPASSSALAAAHPTPTPPSSSTLISSSVPPSDPALSHLIPNSHPLPSQPSNLSVTPPTTISPDLITSPSAAVPSSQHNPTPLPHRPLLANPHRSSNPIHQQPSYAQIAKGSRGPGFVRSHASDVEAFARLPRTGINIVCGSREGLPSFSFTNSDLPRVEKLYSNALVMKFHGGRPSLESSHKEISSWGMNQPFTIGPLSSRAFLLRFQDDTDLLKVLTRPSTTLINFPYKVFRWHSLCHIKEDSCIAPVWISLPRLPLQCFVPEFLEAVANKIGRFLCLDKATATLARPSAARLCIELDLRRPLPQFIWVGLFDGFKQQILYEKLPKFCNECHIQGHSSVECFKAPSAVDCPQGQRETPTAQTGARANPNRQRTPAVRQNSSKHLTSLHQHPTSTSTIPSPHIPTPPPNPPPPSSQPPPNPPPSSSLPLHTTNPHAAVTADANANLHSIEATYPPPNQSTVDLPLLSHPNTPHKSSSTSHTNRSKDKHKHKSVTFASSPTQSSMDANSAFWAAVNRQIAIIEQERLTSSSSNPSQTTAGMDSNLGSVAPPPSTLVPESHPNAPSDTASPSASDSQPSSNSTFWEAVNRQITIIEQARLSSTSAIPDQSTAGMTSNFSAVAPPPSTSTPVTNTNASADPASPSASDSQPSSPPTTIQDAQDPSDDIADSKIDSYDSAGEEPITDSVLKEGHATDDSLLLQPQSSKRNKRHPNQPLKFNLGSAETQPPPHHDTQQDNLLEC